MNSVIANALVWIVAGVFLVVLMMRRRRRKVVQ